MNMQRSNSNNKMPSDRAALLSGETSTGRKLFHDSSIDNASQFEQQNDIRLQELNSKLSALHKITLDIHNEANDHNNILDNMGESFTGMGGPLTHTINRLKHMTSTRHKQYMCYLIMIIVGTFYLLYYFWGYWTNNNDEGNQ
ncbi:hypothetical protein Glove_296g55 [Diversispora epigaea]|uniref:t-SNARE coiled-coil homology domain-containing protein n=1 Tax=Diversispora epigaea TaxID=1348612 RepID=A0A397I363_9GLOM|nr:hypothetical protein Glove_296g55 [Diversispora epigaea]